ncbi:MAG TPA: DUF4398 domain-containing protein [Gammaproteobacteria bacterium]|nr:DUF4398 domain-containing protein [Gammaproteobacteria bacterium]
MATSFAHFRTPLQALILGCVLALTACASLPPPTAELNAAQQAVSRAADADADQYAPEDLARASTMLTQAQAAMAERREADARDLATRSAALAGLALARSREASTGAELEQRRAEIAELRQRLRMEDAQ